jgi:hypothetical protein
MVNELIEAENKSELNRVTRQWTRYELIVIDELAYVAMPEAARRRESRESGSGRHEEFTVLGVVRSGGKHSCSILPRARVPVGHQG